MHGLNASGVTQTLSGVVGRSSAAFLEGDGQKRTVGAGFGVSSLVSSLRATKMRRTRRTTQMATAHHGTSHAGGLSICGGA